MPQPKKVSFTALAHQVVFDSPAPLTAAEIQARVNAITPITTKKPKSTIRNAITQSQMIVSVGNKRYGWKPRIISGSLLRHTLSEAELVKHVLHWDDDLLDAICPTFFAKQMYQDRSPVSVALSDGSTTTFPLEFFGGGTWGSHADDTFFAWLDAQSPAPGDHLLFRIVDGEAKQYAVTFQARRDRDEAAIAARNEAFLTVAAKLAQRPYGAADWDITTHLLAHGFYHHPTPPNPFSEIWTESVWRPLVFGEESAISEPPDAALSVLFGVDAQVHNPDNPPGLPPEYDPARGRRRPRLSRKARTGSVTAYTFRVSHRAVPDVWRDIQLAEDQTLEDLHLVIQSMFGWGDDHLYSFFMSGKSQDATTEIGCPWSETSRHTHQVEIGNLQLHEKQTFLYFFDYGDSHEFDVTVIDVDPLAPKGNYPKRIDYHGIAPPQYPFDPDTGDMLWDPFARP